MENNFLSKFLRKDLNLKDKWWHRLFIVLLIITSILFTVSFIPSYIGNHWERWKKIEGLSERITSEIKPLKYFIRDGERIDEDEYLNRSLSDYDDFIMNRVYCSNNISTEFPKIQEAGNIDNLFIRNLYEKENVSPKIFSEYIEKNNIKCLAIDSYTYNDEELFFLEPDKSYQEKLSFYKKSLLKSILYFMIDFLSYLLISILYFILILVLYYKVIIFIIFGRRKN